MVLRGEVIARLYAYGAEIAAQAARERDEPQQICCVICSTVELHRAADFALLPCCHTEVQCVCNNDAAAISRCVQGICPVCLAPVHDSVSLDILVWWLQLCCQQVYACLYVFLYIDIILCILCADCASPGPHYCILYLHECAYACHSSIYVCMFVCMALIYAGMRNTPVRRTRTWRGPMWTLSVRGSTYCIRIDILTPVLKWACTQFDHPLFDRLDHGAMLQAQEKGQVLVFFIRLCIFRKNFRKKRLCIFRKIQVTNVPHA